MGLWIKNADGTIERTAGGGADGADGLPGVDGVDGQPGVDGVDGQPGVDGNMWHVGSGAPASTLGEPGDYYLDGTDGWVHVKRTASSWTNLFVNLTGPPGSGGGGDFLPLSGGTVTGGLTVDGTITASGGNHVLSGGNNVLQLRNSTPASKPYMSVYFNGVRAGYFGNPSASSGGVTELHGEGNTLKLRSAVKVQVTTDLQVDGHVTTGAGKAVYFGGNWDGAKIFNVSSGVRKYMTIGDQANGGSQIVLYGNNEADGGTDDGKMYIRSGGEPTVKLAADQSVHFYGDVTSAGTINARIAFGVADGIDTQGVLERAETATMPVIDEEGVATADAEGVMLNDVVAALLLKVKELSARIETLEGQTRL